MGGLLQLIQRGGDWAGPQPVQAPFIVRVLENTFDLRQFVHRRHPRQQEQVLMVAEVADTQYEQGVLVLALAELAASQQCNSLLCPRA